MKENIFLLLEIIHTLEYKFDYLKEKNGQINLLLKKMEEQNMNFLFFSFYVSLHYVNELYFDYYFFLFLKIELKIFQNQIILIYLYLLRNFFLFFLFSQLGLNFFFLIFEKLLLFLNKVIQYRNNLLFYLV